MVESTAGDAIKILSLSFLHLSVYKYCIARKRFDIYIYIITEKNYQLGYGYTVL